MKSFFEEYGRVIVTVLIILGIILVGYVIAGNGQNSAFGRFTTATVDSLTGQASSLIQDSAEYIAKTAHEVDKRVVSTQRGNTKVTSSEKNGVTSVTVEGKSESWNTDSAWNFFQTNTQVEWGKKSVLSFDIVSDKNSTFSMDFNVTVPGNAGNDGYGRPSLLSINGKEEQIAGEGRNISVEKGKKSHIILVLTNSNEKENPGHKNMTPFTGIAYKQNSGKTNYQISNVRYAVI